MTHRTLITAAGLVAGGLGLAAGCAKDGKSADRTMPKTATTMPSAAAPATMPAKEMTHVLAADAPYFASAGPDATPAGTLKGGTKVLLVTPGYPHCQVETADGKTVYTMTDAVESLAPAPPPKPKMTAPATKPMAMMPPAMAPATMPAATIAPATMPAAMMAPATVPAAPMAPATMPAAAAVAPTTMPAKAMTHALTKAQPYYATPPTTGTAPTGSLPAGTQVLLVIPGYPYCKVEMPDGMAVFTMTDGVDAIAKK